MNPCLARRAPVLGGLLAPLLVWTLSCATAQPEASWTDAALGATHGSDVFPDDAAVVLRSVRRVRLFLGSTESWTRVQVQEVIHIRTEAGKALAEVRVPTWGSAKLLDVRARRIDPDGRTEEVPQELMWETQAEANNADDTYSVRVFRVPDVKVGSRIEYLYTLHYPWLFFSSSWPLAGKLPVLHAEFELWTHERLVTSLRVYQAQPELMHSQEGDFRILRFALENVPKENDADMAPHWSFDHPWVSTRVEQVVWGSYVSEPYNTWPFALRFWQQRLMAGEALTQGFREVPPLEGCPLPAEDARCRIERALRWVHEKARWNGFGSTFVRPLREVVDGEEASGMEKTALLLYALGKAGVKAHLAATTRVLTQQTDFEWPSSEPFNHVLVYVPAQGARASTPLWLDVSCEHCALGQLPTWSRGAKAFVLGKDATEGEFLQAEGAPALPPSARRTYDVVVDEEGSARVEVEEVEEGDHVPELARDVRKAKPDDVQKKLEDFATQRFALAQDIQGEAFTCTPALGRCQRRVRFRVPGFATFDGRRWLVPLSLFRSAWDATAREETRKSDVVIRRPNRVFEEQKLKLPAGWTPEQLPPAREAGGGAFAARVGHEVAARGWTSTRQLDVRPGYYRKAEWPAQREVLRVFSGERNELVSVRSSPGSRIPVR